jgi:beta-galactosidase/beta-glucuronidase
LNEQGIAEQFTWMWYRVSFPVPPEIGDGPVHLWFGEIDGRRCKVFVNGQLAGELQGNRKPSEVEVTGMLLPGRENTVAVKIDHSKISELDLGGIIRPAMLYGGPRPEGERQPD